MIAQPSLSAIVKKAEVGLGMALFQRSPRQVAITPEGRRILAAFSVALKTLQGIHPQESNEMTWTGTFRLGIIPTLGPYLLPSILPHFRSIEWELVESQTARLVKLLGDGRLDAGLVSLPLEESGLAEMPLFREELVLAVPRTHHLADRESVSLSDIDSKEMILLEKGHCLREDVLRQCGTAHVTAKPTHAASLEVQRLMVKANAGCAVFPSLATKWDRDSGGMIRYVPFESPVPNRTIGLAYRKSHPRSLAIEAIGKELRAIDIEGAN
jgi:LysR family hydrogen peroxide-inducible transcriptional activator